MSRSLQLSLVGIHQARMAFYCLGDTQDDFADKLKVSRGTVSNFLNGKPVYRKNFYNFCEALNLEVKNVMLTIFPISDESTFDGEIEPSLSQQQGGLPVQLKQWIENKFEEDWLDISIITSSSLAYSTRFSETDVCRGRIIILNKFYLSLLIFLKQLTGDKLYLKIQVHPQHTEYLPLRLKLVLLSNKQVIKEVIAKEDSNFIQAILLELSSGEEFTLKIIHQEFSFTKSFIF